MKELLEDLKKHYAALDAPHLGMGSDPALLVVDFVEGFTHPDSPLAGPWDAQVVTTAKVLDAVRKTKRPVIFTTVSFSPRDLQSNLLYRKTPGIETLMTGSLWTRIDRRLQVEDGDLIIDKKHGSAFFGTALASQLQMMRIDTLVICGCVTSACVRATAVDAAQNGFIPIVLEDAVGDRSPLAQLANLMDIEQRYGDVLSSTEFLQQLQS